MLLNELTRKSFQNHAFVRRAMFICMVLVAQGCAISPNYATIKVTDIGGTPLIGADVRVGSGVGTGGGGFKSSGGSKTILERKGKTDDKGEFFFFGVTSSTVHITAKKEGYYGGSTYLGEQHSTVLPLRPKISPVSAYIKKKSVKLPSDKGLFGFDIVIGDLVKPFGKGDRADFFFEVKPRMWKYSESRPAKKMLGGHIKINQSGGGFVAHYQGSGRIPSSGFNRPYHAPAIGYVTSIIDARKKAPKKDNGKPLGWHWIDSTQSRYREPYLYYYFKTRTDSPSGPLYGIVTQYSGFSYRGSNRDVPYVRIEYLYNSDRTSNLEIQRF